MFSAESVEQRERALISQIFHDLSQPLTALQCTLELSLQHDRDVDQLRGSISTALDNAERLRQRLLLVRALNDASDPDTGDQYTELNAAVRELHQELLPLFQSAGSQFEILTSENPVRVKVDRTRLMRALVCFLEYLFQHSHAGSVTRIAVAATAAGQAGIQITSGATLPIAHSDEGICVLHSCEAELAQRTLRSAGGDFALYSWNSDQSVWRAALPMG